MNPTIFELGSVSKSLTATLGVFAEASGKVVLAAPASRYASGLSVSGFDSVPLRDLATYTAGGLPLQFPDDVKEEAMVDYFRNWKPEYSAGTVRRYSNPSIGLFGYLVANELGTAF